MSALSPGYLDVIRDRANRAADHVGRLCTKEDHWTMSVPVRDTDSDVLLMDVAGTDVPDLLAEVERLRAGIAQAITEADEIAHTTGPCTGTNCAGCRTGRLEYGLRTLLNPTEGEDR